MGSVETGEMILLTFPPSKQQSPSPRWNPLLFSGVVENTVPPLSYHL